MSSVKKLKGRFINSDKLVSTWRGAKFTGVAELIKR